MSVRKCERNIITMIFYWHSKFSVLITVSMTLSQRLALYVSTPDYTSVGPRIGKANEQGTKLEWINGLACT